jgi:hypothetical protein
MDNIWNGAWILAIGIVFSIYYFDIGGVATEKEKRMVYMCEEIKNGRLTTYFSKRNIKGDNCTPPSAIMLKQDIFSDIRE